MPGISRYERMQIGSLFQYDVEQSVVRGVGLVMLGQLRQAMRIHETAIVPAFRKCDLDDGPFVRVFDSDSPLVDVSREIASAEVIIADLTGLPAHLMYVVGLCHAIGRCPILLTQSADELPFNLASLRYVEYTDSTEGLMRLREDLARAMRVFLMATHKDV